MQILINRLIQHNTGIKLTSNQQVGGSSPPGAAILIVSMENLKKLHFQDSQTSSSAIYSHMLKPSLKHGGFAVSFWSFF